jgi:molybdopterin converting factor small subunit
MKVLIPSPLRSYTQRSWVEASGSTLGAVLDDLDRQFPGIRFRMVNEQDAIRPHVRFFVKGEALFRLAEPLQPADELLIVQALSGG